MSRKTGLIKKKSTAMPARHTQQRDYVEEAVLGPRCVICGDFIPRTKFRDGTVQARTVWMKRKFCSHPTHPRKKSECGIEFIRRLHIKPETHKYCSVCNKRLSRHPRKIWEFEGGSFICQECIPSTDVLKGREQSKEHIKNRINSVCLTRYGHEYSLINPPSH